MQIDGNKISQSNSSYILAFDCSDKKLSVALISTLKNHQNPNSLLQQIIVDEHQKHSEILIPTIEEILRNNKIWYNDLVLVATTKGPGSFTGIRVALSVAKIIKITQKIPAIALNCCEVLAYKYYLNNFDHHFSENINLKEENEKNSEIKTEKVLNLIVAMNSTRDDIFCAFYKIQKSGIIEEKSPFTTKINDFKKIIDSNTSIIGSAQKLFIEGYRNEEINGNELTAYDVAKLATKRFSFDDFFDKSDSEKLEALYLYTPNFLTKKLI